MVDKKENRRKVLLWDPTADMIEPFFSFSSLWPSLNFDVGVRAPLMDIEDRGNELVVSIDMPGVKKENINIEVQPNYLTVSAEYKHKKEKKKKNYYFKERKFVGYSRSASLPEEVIPSKVTAKYENGVLIIHLPKVKATHKKTGVKIKVQ